MAEPRFVVRDALGERVVSLDKMPYRIGRGETDDLRLGGEEVSREHAEVVKEGGGYLLRDKKSRYGTFVNGEAVIVRALRSGDRIRLGRGKGAHLEFRTADAASLKIYLTSGETLQHDLRERRTTIGRSLTSDVVIPDVSVSRHHAVILRQTGGYSIEDFSSRHGVFVNGERIRASSPLSDGDEILLGTCRAVLVLHDEMTLSGAEITMDSAPAFAGPGPVGEVYRIGAAERGFLAEDIYRQLEAARAIQKLLLPRTSPSLAGYRLFADSQPCYAVDGDFFDFLELQNGGIGLVLGDVSGKGLGAALLAHFTQAIIRTALRYEPRLDRVLPRVNEDICDRSLPNQFVTVCVCVLDPASGDLHYINAGHCPPLVIQEKGKARFLNGASPLLGVSPDFVYDVQYIRLEPESAIVLYSDGFTECTNGDAIEFGADRLAKFFASRATELPELILRDLENQLEQFGVTGGQTDDMTLLLLQRDATAPAGSPNGP